MPRWSGCAWMTSSPRNKGRGGFFVVFFLYPHVVAIGNAVIAVESVAGGQKFWLVSAVPFADYFGGVAFVFEEFGDGDFAGI